MKCQFQKMAFLNLLCTEPSGISVLLFPHTVLISVQKKLGLFCNLSFFPHFNKNKNNQLLESSSNIFPLISYTNDFKNISNMTDVLKIYYFYFIDVYVCLTM